MECIFPLLVNIYLNEFDQEYGERVVAFVCYADDIVLLTRSDRAAKRLLESSTKYLEAMEETENEGKEHTDNMSAGRVGI